jgi:adenosylmethionine-8-amino-7-oxononanoate aminotransferase
MSGFEEPGKWFDLHHGIVPDMVCMAKGLTRLICR